MSEQHTPGESYLQLMAEKAELLEALALLLEWVSTTDADNIEQHKKIGLAIDKARAAIAKAEPSTPEQRPGMAYPGLQTGQGMATEPESGEKE